MLFLGVLIIHYISINSKLNFVLFVHFSRDATAMPYLSFNRFTFAADDLLLNGLVQYL